MLGWDFVRLFSDWFERDQVQSIGRREFDVRSREQVFSEISKRRPALVINCSAYTNVDGAESEREEADAINHIGTQNLVEVCREIDATFVHFSTDQVFDGKQELPYSESDPVAPCNQYAATKRLGEIAALEYQKSIVLRVQWLYGEKKDRFTLLRDKKVFTPFRDQIGAPTWTEDICRVVAHLVAGSHYGLYHLAYDDFASWYEVFQFVKEHLQLETELRPMETKDVQLPACRPQFSTLSNQKLLKTLGWKTMGSWRDSLGDFLESRRGV